MLTYLFLGYFLSTVSFSATNAPICGFDSPNKIAWHEDYLGMSYCCKRENNPGVVGLGTWCGRPKIQQRGGKLMAPTLKYFLYKYNQFWSIGGSPYDF